MSQIYEKPDFYSKKAKEEGYAARSIYKLMEINDKFNLLKIGQRILDLGCAPGSWAQYAAKSITERGTIIGVDYKEITVNIPNMIYIKGNFFKEEIRQQINGYTPFDGIISDMAPDTKGDRIADCYASSELVQTALNFAYTDLKKGGFFIAKIFQGGDEKEIMNEMKIAFTQAKWFKPKSCRKNSIEIYLIGINFQKVPDKSQITDTFNFDNESGEMPW